MFIWVWVILLIEASNTIHAYMLLMLSYPLPFEIPTLCIRSSLFFFVGTDDHHYVRYKECLVSFFLSSFFHSHRR
jgi:hypothetical protein